MTLRAIEGGRPDDDDSSRSLAPGAPRSPGPLPLDVALALRLAEPVIWWDEKNTIDWRPVGWTAAIGAAISGIAILLVPELWSMPLASVLPPLFAPLLPAVLVAFREWASQRLLLVTDTSIVEVRPQGTHDRLSFRTIRKVRRDFLTGGVLLIGAKHQIRVPPSLAADARLAMASQTRDMIVRDQPVDDALSWLP